MSRRHPILAATRTIATPLLTTALAGALVLGGTATAMGDPTEESTAPEETSAPAEPTASDEPTASEAQTASDESSDAPTSEDAEPQDETSGYDVPHGDYTVVAVSSESDPYPAPPSTDGTSLAAIDGNVRTQWTSRYVDQAPYPHWIVLDIGDTLPLTAVDYSVVPNQNGVAGRIEVFVTDDADLAADPDADWGEPVGASAIVNPTTPEQRQRIAFDEVVEARYVRVVLVSPLRENAPSGSASELVVVSSQPIAPDEPDDPAESVTLTDGAGFDVAVGTAFPQVVSYDVDGAPVGGQPELLDTFRINGEDVTATTEMTATEDTATYVSTVDELGLTITSTLTVTDERTVEFQITDIAGDTAVETISIPGHALLSTTSDVDGAELARTTIDVDSTSNADEFLPITADAAVDSAPVGAALAFLDAGDVVGGVITNGTVDKPSGTSWNQQLLTRVTGTSTRTASISTAQWTYQPAGATDPRVTPYALPSAVVYFASDTNGTDGASWQDAAIRYRDLVPAPLGAERVPDRVVDRIPFNIVSHATNPFQLTLDNTLRIANSTDYLGQFVLEKGYGNEGHDSANSDYGGNYNIRAGDLDGLNELVNDGALLNADFFVHVNATEAYPQANSFSDELITQPPSAGWNWMNQSYYIDQRHDLGQGAILDRFSQLNEEVPGLDGVYIDVYYSSGWLADGLAAELGDMDLEVASEWADKFSESSVWAHWPNDLNYGGAENKGVNSQMIRFVQNSRADIWNDDPLLGSQRLVDAEGWSGNQDWNAFLANIWDRSLPTKFVQHFDLLSWELGDSATLTDDVSITLDGDERVITVGGAEVLRGDDYLLPWQSVESADETSSPLLADKMYFYAADGGERTFDLTERFEGVTSFDVYTLGDTGRSLVGTVASNGSTLTLTGDAGVPYLVVPAGDAQLNDPGFGYGQGSALTDPGFNSGSLQPWSPQGEAEITATENGDNVAVVGEGASSISQEITGLEPGTRYSFSADVEIEPTAPREVSLAVDGGTDPAATTFDLTPARNYVGSDSKRDTYSQRASVSFVAPESGTVTVSISVADGATPVTLDAARVMIDTRTTTPEGVAFSEDFEGNQPGWGPFVKGESGGTGDARTSISWDHAPYTDSEWKNTAYPHQPGGPQPGNAVDDVLNGRNSLKLHDQQAGLAMRTVPATVSFTDGHRYRVSVDYQVSNGAQYSWVTGADSIDDGELTSTVLSSTPLPQALETATHSYEFVAGCGENWVGVQRTGGPATDLVLDDLAITDLGVDPTGAACATLGTEPSSLNPGAADTLTTTFTNGEDTTVTDVWLGLAAPDGWTVQVADASSNLVESVQPGETVTVDWVVTAPEDAAGTSVTLDASAQYLTTDCVTRQVEASLTASVATRARIPNTSIEVTASSENAGDGEAANVLDNDPSTIWHSRYDPTIAEYPHWLTFDLGETRTVEGLGYLRRPAHTNGPIKDYVIETSSDGETWTEVATGAFQNLATWQDVELDAVEARWVRLTATSSISGNEFAAAAEIAIYGTVEAPAAHDPAPRPDPEECVAQPSIDLGADTVPRGGSLEVSLSGFPADTRVQLRLGDIRLGTVTTDAEGAATTTVTIPGNVRLGVLSLHARVGRDVLASADVTVTKQAKPVLTTDRTTVPRLETVEVSLADFPAGARVQLWLGDIRVRTVTVEADGTADTTFRVPADHRTGRVKLEARVGSEVLDSVRLTVVKPEVEVERTTVARGETVGVDLSSFPAGSRVQLWLGDIRLATVVVDGAGEGSTTLLVPQAIRTGRLALTARVGSTVLDTVTLTVTKTPTGAV